MLPAGKYWVGDLCYVLNDRWDEFCDITLDDNKSIDGEFTLSDGTRFASYGTRWGDGQYPDQFGNLYPVDAGLIGCVLVDDIHDEKENWIEGGHVHEFKDEFETKSNSKGTIRIGHVKIKTGDN